GDATAVPNASTVNPSTPIAFNAWASGIPASGSGAGTFAVYSTNALDVIVDVVGYFAPSNLQGEVGQLTFVNPTRVVDTRAEAGGPIGLNADGSTVKAGTLTPNATRRFLLSGKSFAGLALPPDVKGVLANVTTLQSEPSGGFVTAFP